LNAHTSITPAADIDLTAIMRAEGIRDIRRDPLTDWYGVTISDWITGYGGTVGEALADAKRRAERDAQRRAA
jgi:hypothetical protein